MDDFKLNSLFCFLALLVVTTATANSLFAQREETVTGCLSPGDRQGYYSLETELGDVLTVTGDSAVRRYAENNYRVRVTGVRESEQGQEVFRVRDIEFLNTSCNIPLEFSRDALNDAIGRARLGVRGGIGFDPEVLHFGVHAQTGPIIRNLWFRPNVEVGFGEVTEVYSLNFEFVYFFPFLGRGQQGTDQFWTVYAGAGPSVNFIDRDFEGEPDEGVDIDDFDTDIGANFLMGVLRSDGLFGELKAGAYGSPNLRVTIGYTF